MCVRQESNESVQMTTTNDNGAMSVRSQDQHKRASETTKHTPKWNNNNKKLDGKRKYAKLKKSTNINCCPMQRRISRKVELNTPEVIEMGMKNAQSGVCHSAKEER